MIDFPDSARNTGWRDYFQGLAATVEAESELPAAVADVLRVVGELEQDGVLEDVASSPLEELLDQLEDAELGAALGTLLSVQDSHAVGHQLKVVALLDLVLDALREEVEVRGLEFDSPV